MADKMTADEIERIIVKQFKEDPEYMKQMVMDEFDNYQKTNDIRQLLVTLRCAMKSTDCTSFANECEIIRDTIYKLVSHLIPLNTFTLYKIRKIFDYLGLNLSLKISDILDIQYNVKS